MPDKFQFFRDPHQIYLFKNNSPLLVCVMVFSLEDCLMQHLWGIRIEVKPTDYDLSWKQLKDRSISFLGWIILTYL